MPEQASKLVLFGLGYDSHTQKHAQSKQLTHTHAHTHTHTNSRKNVFYDALSIIVFEKGKS
jgi:hypothetical protein